MATFLDPLSNSDVCEVIGKLYTFRLLAGLKCSCCDDWTSDPSLFGLKSLADWHKKMDACQAWTERNPSRVKAVLPFFEVDDPDFAIAVEAVIKPDYFKITKAFEVLASTKP